MSIIVILNFAVDDDYIYFFQFSSALLQKPFSFIVGFHFYGYAVCVLHVVLKHFREIKRSPSADNFYFSFVLSQLSFPANILWALLILSL